LKFRNPAEKGNALFLILIAVALFAALSYAVTQTGRGGGTTSREQTALLAAQITQAGADLKTVATRMVLTGTPVASLQFGVNPTEGANLDALGNWLFCTSGPNCVFAPDGGGAAQPSLPVQVFDQNARNTNFGGKTNINQEYATITDNGGFKGIGQDLSPDVVVLFPAIRQDICVAINQGLGLGSTVPVFIMTFPAPLADLIDPGFPAPVPEAGCINAGAPGDNFYYQILVAN
jgi:hypothetical protein